MFGKIDYGAYYKFLASVGLTLMAGSLIVPWVFFQAREPLVMSQADLNGLTDVAKSAIEQRQAIVAALQTWVIVLSVGLLVAGVVLLAVGLLKWRDRQARSDRSEDLDFAAKEREHFVAASASEIAGANRDEALDELPGSGTPGDLMGKTNPQQGAGLETQLVARNNFMHQAKWAESRAQELFAEAYERQFLLQTNVKAGSSPFVLDLVLDPAPETPWGQLGVDFKLMSGMHAPGRIAEAMVRVAMGTITLALGDVFSGRRGRPARAAASGVLFVVLRKDESQAFDPARTMPMMASMVDRVNAVLVRPVGVVVVVSDEFENVSADHLQRAVTVAWRSGSLALLASN